MHNKMLVFVCVCTLVVGTDLFTQSHCGNLWLLVKVRVSVKQAVIKV